MDEKRIKAYCKKPDCLLKRIGIRKYNFYSPSEIESMVNEFKKDLENLEFQLRKAEVIAEPQTDILDPKRIDGAVIRTRDYAVSVRLEWYELNRINADIYFDKDYKHSEDEYKSVKKILRKYDFHILKLED